MNTKRGSIFAAAAAGILLLILILVLGTIWMGQSARDATEEAVHSVSLLYMDELAEGRVVERVLLIVAESACICVGVPACDLLR